MKKQTLTILLFLFFGSNCIGQKKDSINIGRDITGTIIHTINSYSTSATQKQDTVKVLMLCTDSNYSFNNGVLWVDSLGTLRFHFPAYSIFGYEVQEKVETNDWVIDADLKNGHWWSYYKHISYLDQNKKPLQKSILVWQTKEIK